MKLPDKRDFGWTLKSIHSAHTEINNLPNGQVELIIHHEKIKGITIEMLQWWFERFPYLTIFKGGQKFTAYDLWHPLDHVGVYADPKNEILKQGDHVTICECFQRDLKFYGKGKALIYYFRKDGFGLQVLKSGIKIMQLLHKFEPVEGGVSYKSRMLVGLEKGLFKNFVNKVIIPNNFGPEKANAWLQHNVEEVGCFENFLEDIYSKRAQGKSINLDL